MPKKNARGLNRLVKWRVNMSTVHLIVFAVVFASAGAVIMNVTHAQRYNAPGGQCNYSNGVVSATGLPTDQVINFLYTTNGVKNGWVLGYSGDGSWNVNVSAPTQATTYHFVSKTWSKQGNKYTVFAQCTAQI